MLEVGVGPGVVKAFLASCGCQVVTVDVNGALDPDVIADVRHLPETLRRDRWEWLILSRVLHHIPRTEIPGALDSVQNVDADRFLVTVPREDLSVQISFRRTAGATRNLRISGGARLKRVLRRHVIRTPPSGSWMLDGRDGISRSEFRAMLCRRFTVEDEYVLADDPSHVFYILRPRQ